MGDGVAVGRTVGVGSGVGVAGSSPGGPPPDVPMMSTVATARVALPADRRAVVRRADTVWAPGSADADTAKDRLKRPVASTRTCFTMILPSHAMLKRSRAGNPLPTTMIELPAIAVPGAEIWGPSARTSPLGRIRAGIRSARMMVASQVATWLGAAGDPDRSGSDLRFETVRGVDLSRNPASAAGSCRGVGWTPHGNIGRAVGGVVGSIVPRPGSNGHADRHIHYQSAPLPPTTGPPLFSIFIPTRNDAGWLSDAIASARAQTVGDWELVIGDNVSEDATREVATVDDARVRYHRWESVVDVNGNFNRTAALCTGEWLVPLGSDDRLRPHALATFADQIRNREDLVMVVAACSRIDQDGHPAAGTWRFYQGMARLSPGDYDAASWMAAMSAEGQPPWNLGSIAFRRSAVEQLGGLFNPDAGPAADIELVLRMPLAGPVRYLDEPVMIFTQRTDSDAKVQQQSNRLGSGETILGRGLRVGTAAHEQWRGPLRTSERRTVNGLIARSFIQRAAQHRLLAGGAGRQGAFADLRNAWRTSPTTVLTPRQLVYSAGAILAPTSLLRAADRALRLDRA